MPHRLFEIILKKLIKESLSMVQTQDRIRAAWQGLLTGDKIGGPYAMARQLAQSLAECGGSAQLVGYDLPINQRGEHDC